MLSSTAALRANSNQSRSEKPRSSMHDLRVTSDRRSNAYDLIPEIHFSILLAHHSPASWQWVCPLLLITFVSCLPRLHLIFIIGYQWIYLSFRDPKRLFLVQVSVISTCSIRMFVKCATEPHNKDNFLNFISVHHLLVDTWWTCKCWRAYLSQQHVAFIVWYFIYPLDWHIYLHATFHVSTFSSYLLEQTIQIK